MFKKLKNVNLFLVIMIVSFGFGISLQTVFADYLFQSYGKSVKLGNEGLSLDCGVPCENLIWGLVKSDSAGNFIRLQDVNGTIYTDKFKLDHSGNVTAAGNIEALGNMKADGQNVCLQNGTNCPTTISTASNLVAGSSVVSDAEVDNNITLDNITQITNRSHSNLQNLTADDHAQYLLVNGTRAMSGALTVNNNLILNGQAYITGAIRANNHITHLPWQNFGSIPNGYIKLVTPIIHNESNMFSIHIFGYEYSGGSDPIDIQCVGYAYSGSTLINTQCYTEGTDIPVEIGTENRGNTVVVIRLGSPSQGWYYPQLTAEYIGWNAKDPSQFAWVSGETTPAQTGNTNNVFINDQSGYVYGKNFYSSDQGAWLGDITAVIAGTGLSGGGTSGSVTLNADTNYLQRRVSGICAVGSSIRVINADGAVVCEADDTGITTETDPTITQPNIKDGVSWTELSGIPGGFSDNTDDVNDADFDPSNEIQDVMSNQGLRRNPTNKNFGIIDCAANEIVKRTADGKQWACAADNVGVTAHNALTGLGNDDHTQYLLVNGTRAMSGALTANGGINLQNAEDTDYKIEGKRSIGEYPGWDANRLYINAYSDWSSGVTVAGDGGLKVDAGLNVVGVIKQGGTAVSLLGHTHGAGDIISGTLLTGRGGTGLSATGSSGNLLRSNGTIWESWTPNYLTSEVDGSVTNEIQTLGISGNNITLSLGGGSVTAPYASNADTVDSQHYNANWPTTLANMQAAVSNDFHNLGGTDNVNDADASATNEIQNVIANQGLTRDGSNNFGIMDCAANEIVKRNAGDTAWACAADIGGMTNPMTALGDIIYGGTGGAATKLAGAAGFLKSTGSATPVWSALTAADIPDLNTSKITAGTFASSRLSGSYPNITGVGTLTVGTWNGSPITDSYISSASAWNGKAPTASPTFTGTPTAPTATAGTNTTQLATTAFATAADNLKANLASPTFTGTVSGITAAMVGLGNVTNESKATMFSSPTFTGTVSGITAAMVGLGNVTNESKATMFSSPAFTGSVTMPGTGIWNSSGDIGIGTKAPAARLSVSGSISTAISTKTEWGTAYYVTRNDSVLIGNATQDGLTFYLPVPTGIAGRRYTFKNITPFKIYLSINSSTAKIDGVLLKTLKTKYSAIVVVSDGTQWIIESQMGTIE